VIDERRTDVALARACVYHSVGFDLRNLAGAALRPESNPTAAGERDVKRFEDAFAGYVGVRHCSAFAYARSAIHFALATQAFDPGSEIIMSPITIKPMMDAVLSLGLRPVFVDIDPDSLIFDLADFDEMVGPQTRAVLLTYLFGVAADPRPIISRCRERGIFVIEDFSHNLGAAVDGRQLGTFGDVGVYSCSPTKTLDAYGGGLAVTDRADLADELAARQMELPHPPARRIRPKILRDLLLNVMSRKLVWSTFGFPLVRTLRRYAPHLELVLTAGPQRHQPTAQLAPDAFERLSPRQARAGLAVLPAVARGDEIRRSNNALLHTALRSVGARFPLGTPGARHVYWQSVVDVDDVSAVQAALAKAGVDAGTTNLSLVAELGVYPEYERSCPTARRVKESGLYVPAHVRVSSRGLRRVADALVSVLGAQLRAGQDVQHGHSGNGG